MSRIGCSRLESKLPIPRCRSSFDSSREHSPRSSENRHCHNEINVEVKIERDDKSDRSDGGLMNKAKYPNLFIPSQPPPLSDLSASASNIT
eukprot:gene6318-biopygen13616